MCASLAPDSPRGASKLSSNPILSLIHTKIPELPSTDRNLSTNSSEGDKSSMKDAGAEITVEPSLSSKRIKHTENTLQSYNMNPLSLPAERASWIREQCREVEGAGGRV